MPVVVKVLRVGVSAAQECASCRRLEETDAEGEGTVVLDHFAAASIEQAVQKSLNNLINAECTSGTSTRLPPDLTELYPFADPT